MEPFRRRWWALAITAEGFIVLALSAWALSAVVDDNGPVWAIAALVAVWSASFMACTALRPSAARKFGFVTAPFVAFGGPLLLAFITR